MTSTKQQRVILVTGANKGLGFEVVKKLLNESSTSTENLVLLGSRDLKRGQDAINQLGSPSNVHILQLDTSSTSSIAHAVDEIKQKYGGQLDILINNAGIVTPELTVDAARQLLATNYYGVKTINEHFFPLMKENGRIVNVASEIGAWKLYEMSDDLQRKYKSSTLTTEQLDGLVEEFVSAIESKRLTQLGYDEKTALLAYGVSKTAVIALTHIEARLWSSPKKLLVLSVCPGYCDTDMNENRPGTRPVALGADSILHAVNAPADQLKNGQFYQDGQIKLQAHAAKMDLN